MSNWKEADLKVQFGRVLRDGWLAHFEEAAVKNNFQTEHLMGVASRETNIQNIIGDGGRGYGVMQVDIATNKSFCESGKWHDPRMAIGMGTAILATKRDIIANSAGQPFHVKTRDGSYEETFKMPALSGDLLLRVAIAAYNSGMWSPRNYAKYANADRGTTGGDYSSDVLARAEVFKTLLDKFYEEKMEKERPNAYGRKGQGK